MALGVLIVMTALALLAPLLAPHDPVRASLPDGMMPPMWMEGGSSAHILGTDGFGRDIASRLLYGARISLSVAALSIIFGGMLGAAVGIVSGYVGGTVDVVIMRLVDIVMALPTVLVAIALAVAAGPSFRNLVIVISALLWPKIARQVRGETLVLRELPFVQYARTSGVGALRLMGRHILPNVLPTILVVSTLEIGGVILLEATLGFLGAGVPPPQPSWGVIVADGSSLIATGWWIALFPGVAIVLTVLAFNSLGDWLRDRFDPRSSA